MISLDNFIGNHDLINLLRLSIAAAKERNQSLPHILLKGPAGTGKTTLAEVIARAFNTEPLVLTPVTARKTEELRRFFLRMPGEGYDLEGNIVGDISPQIIWCDEVHQLPLVAQENLGIAMQDWKLPVRIGNEDVFEWVPRFTLIGATTLPGKLSKPFLDRFKIHGDFETYSHDESMQIVQAHAERQGLVLAEGVANAIARRSRGVARLIVRFLDRLHDAAVVVGRNKPGSQNVITIELAESMFEKYLKVDDRGLTKSDVKLLIQLTKINEPVGIDTLALIANEDKTTIQNTVEPYLIQEGLVARTKRGRIVTDEGRRYLESAGYLSKGAAGLRSGRVLK